MHVASENVGRNKLHACSKWERTLEHVDARRSSAKHAFSGDSHHMSYTAVTYHVFDDFFWGNVFDDFVCTRVMNMLDLVIKF
jgi:hypothetical protein